ncbi:MULTISPECIES: TetR family transcriptional regulator [unclassified Mycobacterium]|uniref:TetR/AcrR family transcriptional regulator n=1 Tax=unclassified Mycobacterium TaxID=2642494 RepID=UPI0004196659|nr:MULTISPECIES: TetR family transcriptional regulator [unclassified Mycobacterium]
MRRKPNPQQRRRELCDAAIRLLADDGLKGVSHLKVDRKAGVPDGSASFYFRTRSALLHAVAERVADLDLKDLAAATAIPEDSGSSASGLATLVVRSGTGVRRIRAKARNELALEAARDPVLAEKLRGNDDRFFGLIREAVVRLQPDGADAAAVDEQTYAVMMFISGVMLTRSSGETGTRTAEELDAIISGIVAGVGAVGDQPRSRPDQR